MRVARFTAMALVVALLAMIGQASADTIADWSFTASQPQSAAANTQLATSGLQAGTATASAIGMSNSYAYNGGETTPTSGSCDVTKTSGTAVPSFSEYTWRIRGQTNTSGQPGNGWNTAAPEYTQGIEINASTAGEIPTSFQLDWYSTTQGVNNMQIQYNLNVSNSGGWTNIGPLWSATSNDFYGATAGPPAVANVPVSLSLSGLPSGATDDPNFGMRVVSAYDPTYTGPGAPTYTSAAGPGTTVYNNSSGNWRFDNIEITGTAVPEPSTIALAVGVAGLGLLRWSSRRWLGRLRLKS